jgi:hypothetical protein
MCCPRIEEVDAGCRLPPSWIKRVGALDSLAATSAWEHHGTELSAETSFARWALASSTSIANPQSMVCGAIAGQYAIVMLAVGRMSIELFERNFSAAQ